MNRLDANVFVRIRHRVPTHARSSCASANASQIKGLPGRKSHDNDATWIEKTCPVAIIILPPVWQKWWFILTGSLLGALVFGGAARYFLERRLRYRLQRLEEQHAIEKERTRIAQDMHDEIGAKLAKISFLSGMAKRDLNHPEKVGPEIERISLTARDLLRGLDEIVWAVSPKNDSLENLATYICQYADEFFQKTGIRCHLEIPPRFPHIALATDVRNNLFLAVKESMTNVLKHSGATETGIHISLDDSVLAISIRDNGRGLASVVSAGPRGNQAAEAVADANASGLANMRQRMRDIGGRFELDCAQQGGTTVRFILPLDPGPPSRLARHATFSST